jgi:adenylate cyclase
VKGVAVAARLEPAAPPGGIVISRAVRYAVAGKLKTTLRDLGELSLKNIEQPVQAFRVEWDLADWPLPDRSSPQVYPGASPSSPDKPSVAVLAFDNMSADPDQEYFSDGISEDIVTSPSKNHGIFVIARNSSYAYKGQPVDVSRIGRELGVRDVLEGSVHRAGERVRITAQLIEAERRTHIWAERYDRNLTDLFAVQDEITRSIVATVAPEVEVPEMQRVRRASAETLGAWECAMRAQWHLARMTRDDVAEALKFAAQATAMDPGTTRGLSVAAIAQLYAIAEGWAPSLPHTLALTFSGRGDEAVAPFNEALRLSPRDPFNLVWHYLLAFALFVAGRYEEALHTAETLLRENASVPGAYRIRAASLSELGRIDEARSALADFLPLVPDATVASTRAQVPLNGAGDLDRYVAALVCRDTLGR